MPNRFVHRLLFGPYRPPRCRLGRILKCAVRGEVIVCGMTDARIPWPVGKRGRARSHVVCGGLAQAVRRESNLAVSHWWGVTPHTVSIWRKALGVAQVNPGTRRIKQEQWRRVFTPEQIARNVAKFTPQRAGKIGDALRGKPRPRHIQKMLRRLRLGRKNSPEARAKMSAAHRARGTRPPGRSRTQPT
jgi:hypothetical protein